MIRPSCMPDTLVYKSGPEQNVFMNLGMENVVNFSRLLPDLPMSQAEFCARVFWGEESLPVLRVLNLTEAFGIFKPKMVRFYDRFCSEMDEETRLPPVQERKGLANYYLQYLSIADTWRMVKEYEKKYNVIHQAYFRLRPDIIAPNERELMFKHTANETMVRIRPAKIDAVSGKPVPYQETDYPGCVIDFDWDHYGACTRPYAAAFFGGLVDKFKLNFNYTDDARLDRRKHMLVRRATFFCFMRFPKELVHQCHYAGYSGRNCSDWCCNEALNAYVKEEDKIPFVERASRDKLYSCRDRYNKNKTKTKKKIDSN